MSTSNGVIKKSKDTTAITEKVVWKQQNSDCGENLEVEEFRGFEKVPLVIVNRFDVTPYIKILNANKNNDKLVPVDVSLHSKRLAQKCVVNLVNQDLIELKEALLKLRKRQLSTDSVSDSENDEMASLKCKICEKGYSSEKKLLKHQENKHMIVYKPHDKPQKRVSFSDHVIIHEVKEYHKCRKCPKIFETYKILKSHMKEAHKKRKCYICSYCAKKFVDRIFFKVHIKLHCDVCGLLLPNKVKYTEHRRNVCRILKTHTCKTCDETYFKLMDLKDHSYEHIINCYVCDVCKDQFVTKCEIAHHFSFLHSNNRPTTLYSMRNLGNERLYLCNYCDESSVERDVIESHVQLLPDLSNKAMTGYKDYYFCDQCMKKFDTETDMLQHKWTHFLNSSDNSQTRKNVKKKMKTTYRNGDVIPEYMKPKVVLEKLNVGKRIDLVEYVDVNNLKVNGELNKANKGIELVEYVDTNNLMVNGELKKAIVDPKSKKTIISKHQCQTCDKYYSSNYCLNRHIETQHSDYDKLQCKVCEETFVWPSLLRSHKCIRLNHPEMPFEDARPEIHFDNLNEIGDLNIGENDDYLNTLDFEIPAPIVELTEYENCPPAPQDRFTSLSNLGYKVVMQEVPIEF